MALKKIEKNELYRAGTTYDDEEERKRRETEQQQRQQEQNNVMKNYSSLKRDSFNEIGTALKERSELRKKEEERINNEIKKQVNAVNQNFSKNNPQTVTLPTASDNYRNIGLKNAQDKSKSILENTKLLTEKDKKIFTKTGELGKGELFKATNGAVDDRSANQKKIDNIVAPIANIGVGIESTVPSIVNYENAALNKLSKLGIEALSRKYADKDTAATIGDIVGDKIYKASTQKLQKNLEEEKRWRESTIQNNINRTTNFGSKKIAELAPSLGQNILPMAVAAAPVPGARLLSTALFMTSAAGNYLDDAKQRRMNDDQALGYATVMGLAEGGSEAVISGGMISRVKKAFTGKALSDTFLNSLGTEIAENFAQEAVMEPLQEGTATVIGGEETANWDNIGQRTFQAGLDGVLSAILLKGTSIGIVSSQNVMSKIENNQTVTETDITNMINDLKQYDRTGYEETVRGAVQAIQSQTQNAQQNQSVNQLPVANNTNQNIEVAPRVQNQQVTETLPIANENTLKEQARKEIQNSKVNTEEKKIMLEALDNVAEITPQDMENIRSTIRTSNEIESNTLPTAGNYKYDNQLKKTYMKYKNDKSSYDTTSVNEVLDMIPENRNGRRTIKQWLQVAEEIGQRIANKSNEEIERIAYKSWFDVQPSKNITQYDNQAKKNVGFSKLDSDVWINNIYNGVNKARENGINFIDNQNQDNRTNIKQQQLDIIKSNNPMTDDYHTGIREINDIKTFEEAMQDDESFVYGDFTKEDAEKALEKGKITVYSSNPIEQGSFVSTSQNMAKDYAGSRQIYSQEVNLDDVAWINGDEGQYAKVENIANNQNTLYNNNERESDINGTIQRETMEGSIENNRTIEETIKNQYSEEGFRELTTRARKNQTKQLNENQLKIKNEYEKQINKEIRFFNGTENDMPAFASPDEYGIVYFNSANYEQYNAGKLAYHESLENEITHNKEVEALAKKAIWIMQNDESFKDGKQIDAFYENSSRTTENTYAIAKDILCDMYAKYKAGEDLDYSNLLDINTNIVIDDTLTQIDNILSKNSNEGSFSMQNTSPKANETDVAPKAKKGLDPVEISKLTKEDASTTPKLPKREYAKGKKQSSFAGNIFEDAQFLNEDLRKMMLQEDNIKYYKGITNKDTLEKAYTSLQNGGAKETMNWFNKNEKNMSAEDIAKGWILLKQYQDAGDNPSAVEVAKKMRNSLTNAGQTVQAANILSRLTPEGMFYYAQSELSEAFEKMSEGKTQDWIDEHKSEFDLTPEETQFIKDRMETVQKTEDERTKKVALAEIQAMLQNKIPPTAGQSIKAWMRISMLFNPKTQVRNVMGNTVVMPVNATSDVFAGALDKLISKKTGVRTTGITKEGIKGYVKGFGKGLYESYDDFRRGINTRNVEGNRFEIGDGKSFKDKGIGKALNRIDNILSFSLDAGDRGFYEATFTNSINNQLVLNNTTEVTPEMIEIATNEALQRTWQDNNAYTNAVLGIRNILNGKVGKSKGLGYGLGDILIPFAKTPANLTKAIVDYSPVGLTKSLTYDAKQFTNSLSNGQYSPQLQHKFVQNVGKGLAGSLLYVLGYGLAKAGIALGEADDDKDVKNFMKNSLGINSYSIKIGDKSFTYDWAQPVATPLAIMTNYVKYSKDNPDANALEKAIKSMNIGTEQLLEQSFMESINTVLNGNGTTLENLSQSVLDLPARAIPTFSKQIADMVDEKQRTSFEYGKPLESAINSVKSKIPGLSKTLPTARDTLGNEIEKYGGENNLFNVMFNPANVNKGKLSNAGKEIYDVYMSTGDSTILPRTAPYYINNKGEKITMTAAQRNEFQKITGQYVENTINGLLSTRDYKKLSNDDKAKVIDEIVSDSYAKAKYDVLKLDNKSYEKLRNLLKDVRTPNYYDYKIKTDGMKKDVDKEKVLINSNYSNKEKQAIYETYIKSDDDKNYDIIKTTGIDINEYLKYKSTTFESDKKDDGTVKGKTISGSLKDKKYNYISNMNITGVQKKILWGLEYTPTKQDKQTIVNYISTLPGKTKQQKLDMLSQFSWITLYKDGTFNY